MACIMFIAAAAAGAFASLDLFFFYAFHELALIPTIAVTGKVLNDDERASLRVRAVLPKPFVFDELMRFVNAYASPART